MNKKQLVAAMAEKTGMSLIETDNALYAFTSTVADALKAGDSVQLVGFCTIKASVKAGRVGVNPATGAKINIPAKKVVKIKAGKDLEDSIK